MRTLRVPLASAMSLLYGSVLIVLFIVGPAACTEDTPAPTSPIEPAPPRASEGSNTRQRTDPPTPQSPAKSGRSAYDIKTKCSDSCLFLMDTPFDEVANGGYCKLCAAYDDMACELDWPSSDVPQCGFYDEMRNCIYAGYGRAFKNPKYQNAFQKRDWYKVDPNYDDTNVPAVAQANARHLRKIVKDGTCSPD